MESGAKMDPLEYKALPNNSSGDDDLNVHHFDYGDYDCRVVPSQNATSALCINGTGFRGNFFPHDTDYYYYDNDAGWNFLDIYYSTTRFAVETTMAILSMTLNVLVVSVIGRFSVTRQHTSVYNILFVNLAVTNALTSVLLWFANNLLFLFHDAMMRLAQYNSCAFMVSLAAALFISLAFGIVTTMTMLGFAMVQYFAICRPLQHLYVLRRHKIIVFLALTWATSLIGGFCPLTVLALLVKTQDCASWLMSLISTVVRHGVNVNAAFLALVHIIIVALCVAIYVRMSVIRAEMTPFRFAHDMRTERRANVTIIVLLLTLNAFFVPFVVLQVLSLNSPASAYLGNAALIYYMNLLPYAKCTLDPLIYGLRMRELRECWRYIAALARSPINGWILAGRSRRNAVTHNDSTQLSNFVVSLNARQLYLPNDVPTSPA